MDEDDLANQMLDALRDEGFKSFEEKRKYERFKQAQQDYERYLNCPYD
jgi:hypothetical protein